MQRFPNCADTGISPRDWKRTYVNSISEIKELEWVKSELQERDEIFLLEVTERERKYASTAGERFDWYIGLRKRFDISSMRDLQHDLWIGILREEPDEDNQNEMETEGQ